MFLCLLALWIGLQARGQMIGKKDYDVAFALQAGGNVAVPVPFGSPEVRVQPVGGLKMTFPFNRKWFIGAEVNYQSLRLKSSYSRETDPGQEAPEKLRIDARLRQVEVPLYVKYMLNCNRASVLLGVFGTYSFQADLLGAEAEDVDLSPEKTEIDPVWNAGVTLGYEHQIVKHLNIMCRVGMGVQELMKPEYLGGKKLLPLHAALTLSFDILRIGGCGCD